ncbi:MAG TPA: Rne/Rng family ribonuclease, partial [Alphaproteobacteria bacterium]|nr:Rne/Rng family ribonuclease [Alphaproteobacteria bacterium]
MTTRMLIDATHSEETRVVVVKGNRLEEFDYESSTKKQLKGNIYLAKVTRVEPALQAAFVDYGGNRHGFLAFSEIHPDYYQIPVEDRQALIEEEAAEEEEESEVGARPAAAESEATIVEEAAEADTEDAEASPGDGADEAPDQAHDEEAHDDNHDDIEVQQPADTTVETVGAEDDLEEVSNRRARRSRRYKIQEVIRRRQILLVQVVKEERGNKGAALTTYLSLAGRFCVLMPNTARGGGISRKIANAKDRKRLKSIIDSLNLPEGMGVIVRTAGMEQNKREIKRDYDYLIRLWDTIREQTLKSTAPALIHEEGNLIKRSIRDLYSKDIDEVLVEGDEGYRTAKEFMRMLMPSHAKVVQPYKENIPLFARYQVEGQLDSMFSPTVHLKSGGYIVINSTEALVAIDVNSGRATREHNIEETALKTNTEAAEEVARQLRLRDLAGLVVIDFIDMEKHQNNRSVERRLKERLKHDRARIQVGRISAFGLLEMSRQ